MNQEYAIEFNHVSKIYTLKSKDKKHNQAIVLQELLQ